jgi:hypothetical protein
VGFSSIETQLTCNAGKMMRGKYFVRGFNRSECKMMTTPIKEMRLLRVINKECQIWAEEEAR